jgi:hypothetical protein
VELVMWIVVGIVAGLGFIVLVPVLVVETWFVVLTVILGLADGTIWLLDQGWKKNREATPPCRVLAVESLPRGTS